MMSSLQCSFSRCDGEWESNRQELERLRAVLNEETGAVRCLYNKDNPAQVVPLTYSNMDTHTLHTHKHRAGHNLPDKSCVADTAMQIELA